MEIGERVEINGEELIYTCADTTSGEYSPSELLISLETGACYELPHHAGTARENNFRMLDVDEAVELAKEDSTVLENITYFSKKS